MIYLKKLTILSLALILFLSFTGLSCNLLKKKTDTSTTPTTSTTQETAVSSPPLLTAETTSIDSLFQANFQQAKNKVQQWKTDAVLSAVNIKLPRDLTTNKAIETFVFGSAMDTTNWWTFAISESSGKFVRAIVPKEDYLSEVTKPINNQYWKINYLEALQIAEANGGKAFRENNKETQITLTLAHTQPKGWLWWLVEYKTPEGESLKVRINAFDKSVVDEKGNIVAK